MNRPAPPTRSFFTCRHPRGRFPQNPRCLASDFSLKIAADIANALINRTDKWPTDRGAIRAFAIQVAAEVCRSINRDIMRLTAMGVKVVAGRDGEKEEWGAASRSEEKEEEAEESGDEWEEESTEGSGSERSGSESGSESEDDYSDGDESETDEETNSDPGLFVKPKGYEYTAEFKKLVAEFMRLEFVEESEQASRSPSGGSLAGDEESSEEEDDSESESDSESEDSEEDEVSEWETDSESDESEIGEEGQEDESSPGIEGSEFDSDESEESKESGYFSGFSS